MNLLFLLIAGCFLWGCRVRLTGFAEDYISPENSRCFRGILAVMVMCYHLAQCTGDRSLFHIFVYFCLICVAYFFFMSGYGLQKSYSAKPGYRSRILKKRIPSLLIPYGLLLVAYWGLNWLEGSWIPPMEALLSTFTSEQLVPYSWYIRGLILLYLAYYISTVRLKGNHILIPVCNLLAVIGYSVLLAKLRFPGHWYNTCITFPLGILWAIVEEKCLPWIKKYYYGILAALLPVFGCLFVIIIGEKLYGNVMHWVYWGCCAAFVPLLLLLQLKLTFRNKLLGLLGECSLEIYLLHGFFIILYRGKYIYIQDPALWAAAVIFSTAISAWAFHRLLQGGRK